MLAERTKTPASRTRERPIAEIKVLPPGCSKPAIAFACTKHEVVFSQGDPADAVFYVQYGKIKLSVFSRQGKEAVIAILGSGDFFGEACLAGHTHRTCSATAMADCSILRLDKPVATRLLQEQQSFSSVFVSHLLARNVRIEEDLVDQLFNSSEKRLARALLLLANFGKENDPEPVILTITQETLAEMVGTTRPRISFFLNKFHKLGFIEYWGRGLRVNRSLLSVVLHD